jgi:hypothetical protein
MDRRADRRFVRMSPDIVELLHELRSEAEAHHGKALSASSLFRTALRMAAQDREGLLRHLGGDLRWGGQRGTAGDAA